MSTGSLSAGGSGGKLAFEVVAPMTKFKVSGGKFLDFFQVDDHRAGGSGGDGNPQYLELGNNDSVVEISGCYGSYINQLTIKSSSNVSISAGKPDPTLKQFKIPEDKLEHGQTLTITKITCYAGSFIDRLVIEYTIS